MNTILVSHRGNLNCINLERENTPQYIDEAISKGYDVEIDIRAIDNELYLGHDTPDTPIDLQWLWVRAPKLWIHCKNDEALAFMQRFNIFNYFWHQEDKHTITSKGFVWSYPGNVIPGVSVTVVVDLPSFQPGAKGYCSDFIEQIREMVI